MTHRLAVLQRKHEKECADLGGTAISVQMDAGLRTTPCVAAAPQGSQPACTAVQLPQSQSWYLCLHSELFAGRNMLDSVKSLVSSSSGHGLRSMVFSSWRRRQAAAGGPRPHV